MKTIRMINPVNKETYDIPTAYMTEYMLQGLVPVEDGVQNKDFIEQPPETETNDFVMCGECQMTHHEDEACECENDHPYFPEDVDASAAVDRDVENAVFEPEFTKKNILIALEDINKLNGAIERLGSLQTSDELAAGAASYLNGVGFSAAFARTGRRLWQWVTGRDAKSGEKRWPEKCLSHVRAPAAFQRQNKNYDFDTAVQLARHVAAFHWRQLQFLLDPEYEGLELAKQDHRPVATNPKSSDWVDLTGARILQQKGGGIQLLWDGRKVWLPKSQIKMVNSSMRIPCWLAQKNDMV